MRAYIHACVCVCLIYLCLGGIRKKTERPGWNTKTLHEVDHEVTTTAFSMDKGTQLVKKK